MGVFRYASRANRLKRLLGASLGRPLVGPQVVSLEITHHCNLRCSFCESHGSFQAKPITSRRTYAGGRTTMELSTLRRLAGELAAVGTDLVELSGKGDPIAHPELSEVVRALRGAGLSVSMVTNGTLASADLPSAVVETGLSRINVSLNAGCREVYLRSNHRDLWDRAIGFLRAVLAEKRRLGVDLPWVRLSHVVSRENADDMDGMVAIARELGVNEVVFYVMGELPETREIQITPGQTAFLRDGIDAWSKILNEAGIAHTLAVFARDLEARVRGGEDVGRAVKQENPLQKRLPCYEGWMFCVIGPDGTVVPCCYCEETRLGNVTESSFIDIWYGALYRRFRRESLDMPKTGRWICPECFTSCNRAQENQKIHRRIRPLARTSMPEVPDPAAVESVSE